MCTVSYVVTNNHNQTYFLYSIKISLENICNYMCPYKISVNKDQ